MPLALDASQMVVNQAYPLATSTTEDTIVLTGASPGNPITVQLTSNVSWSWLSQSSSFANKVPTAVLTVRLLGPFAIFVQNATASGFSYVVRLV